MGPAAIGLVALLACLTYQLRRGHRRRTSLVSIGQYPGYRRMTTCRLRLGRKARDGLPSVNRHLRLFRVRPPLLAIQANPAFEVRERDHGDDGNAALLDDNPQVALVDLVDELAELLSSL